MAELAALVSFQMFFERGEFLFFVLFVHLTPVFRFLVYLLLCIIK